MNIVIQCNTFPAGGAVSTLLNASQLTADMNLTVLFETTECCFKSSLMGFYTHVLVKIHISKSAFNGLFISKLGANRPTTAIKNQTCALAFLSRPQCSSSPVTPFMYPCCDFWADQYTFLMSGDSLPQRKSIKKQYPSIPTRPFVFFSFTSGRRHSITQCNTWALTRRR